MAIEYVRFQRGTQAAYDALTKKDENTLYFIYDPSNSSVGALYMGERIISGGDIVLESATLRDLADVLVASTKADSFLVQNEDGKWDNRSVEDVAALIKQYLGEIGAPAKVFQATMTAEDVDHIAAIAKVVGEEVPAAGDIAIVKEKIVDGRFQHTAYVHDGDAWVAMDGNYSANNVYTSEDIQVTSQVGELSADQTVASGTSMADLLVKILSQSKDPSKSDPSITAFSVTNNGSGTSFEVGTSVTPKWDATFNAGSYDYKSTASKDNIIPVSGTGVEVNAWTITKDGVAIGNTEDGTGEAFILGDSTVSFKAVADYSAGNYALTNLNKLPETDVQIEAGSVNKTASISSYRKMFAGGTTATEINSGLIRGLGSSAKAATSSFEFKANVGDTRLIFAYPSNLTTKTPKFEYFTMAWESVGGFTALDAPVKVADVRGGENGLTNYTVYTYTPAAAYAAETKYRVSF